MQLHAASAARESRWAGMATEWGPARAGKTYSTDGRYRVTLANRTTMRLDAFVDGVWSAVGLASSLAGINMLVEQYCTDLPPIAAS